MRVFRLRVCQMDFDRRFLNVLQVGFAFFLIFTAFQSCSVIQETVLQSVNNRTGDVNEKAGYYSLSIIYGAFTLFNFFSAPLVHLISSKWSMVIGGSCFVLFLSSFLKISNAFLYSTSVLLGIGAALLWVGQGQYLTKNSNDETMGRNSAIAWAMLQCSLPVGGIFLYTQFRDSDSLSDQTIRIIYLAFTCMGGLGVLVLALLRRPPAQPVTLLATSSANDAASIEDPSIGSGESPQLGAVVAGTPPDATVEGSRLKDDASESMDETSFWKNFTSTFKLMKTLPMALLAVAFSFAGLELTFFSGVYGTCLSFTEAFGGTSKVILAINVVFIGLGEIIGGGVFGILGKKIHSFIGRSPIILLGMVTHLLAFVLIFINIPPEAPLHKTTAVSYISPNEYLALFCSFLLGFADSCWNTQIYSILGTVYSNNSAPAFAIYKFFQSGAACACFFYSAHLTLEWQLLILSVTCVFGALAFFKVNHLARQISSRNDKAA